MTPKQRTPKPCVRCGTPHHHFATCADGVRLVKGQQAPPFHTPEFEALVAAKSDPGVAPDASSPASEPPAEEDDETTVAADPAATRNTLRAYADALPADSQERKALEIMLARDEARTLHEDGEKALQQATGNPEARLPLPNILREQDEKKSRFMEAEINRVLNNARQAQDPRAMPPREEVMQVKEMLANIPAQRDAAEAAAREAAKPQEHLSGDAIWLCENPGVACHGKPFRSAPMDYVRRKAAAEPTWRFVCPSCQGGRVRLSDLAIAS